MGTTDHAAAQLAELHRFFLEHPVTGPAERHTATVTTPAPLNVTVLDHIQATVAETADFTRTVNPDAGPLPTRAEDVYDWCRRNTAHCPEAQEQRRETLIYRQWLESAILAGDDKAVRPIRCPRCRTFGLMWARSVKRAVCTNARCLGKGGLSSSFTLAHLAYEEVAAGRRTAQSEAT